MIWAFDLDGTLVHTKLAVVASYAHVGIIMPDDAWGKPWHEWLLTADGRPDHASHARKNDVYANYLGHLARPTGLLNFAVSNRCPVLTGASTAAVDAIRERFGIDLNVVGYSMTPMDKVEWLIDPPSKYTGDPTRIYVDDDPTTLAVVKECTTWNTLCPHHASRLLSSPLVPTPDSRD